MDMARCKLCCVPPECNDSQDAYSPLPSSWGLQQIRQARRLNFRVLYCVSGRAREREQLTLRYVALSSSFHILCTNKQTTKREKAGKEKRQQKLTGRREGERNEEYEECEQHAAIATACRYQYATFGPVCIANGVYSHLIGHLSGNLDRMDCHYFDDSPQTSQTRLVTFKVTHLSAECLDHHSLFFSTAHHITSQCITSHHIRHHTTKLPTSTTTPPPPPIHCK